MIPYARAGMPFKIERSAKYDCGAMMLPSAPENAPPFDA